MVLLIDGNLRAAFWFYRCSTNERPWGWQCWFKRFWLRGRKNEQNTLFRPPFFARRADDSSVYDCKFRSYYVIFTSLQQKDSLMNEFLSSIIINKVNFAAQQSPTWPIDNNSFRMLHKKSACKKLLKVILFVCDN